MNLKGYTLILGSNSPRRAELLHLAEIPFTKRVIEVDETIDPNTSAPDAALTIARKKAEAHIGSIEENEIILTADTVVVHENVIYGKPNDRNHAVEILLNLSGKKHEVYTGVCLMSHKKSHGFSVLSQVYFEEISENEARHYVDRCNPLDKAGAYGIQDWIGYAKIEKIEGSYQNIIGLPTARVYKELCRFIEDE